VTNEPSWDEIFSSPPARPTAPTAESAPAAEPQHQTRRQLREQEGTRAPASTFATVTGSDGKPPRKKRRLGWLWAIIVVLVLGGGATAAVWVLFEDQVREVMGWELPYDYEGDGNGEAAEVVIAQGDFGSAIATSLADAGITMTPKAFTELLVSTTPEPTFLPGTYALEKEMSAEAALAALTDGAHQVQSKVLVKEGSTLEQTFAAISEGTGVPVADLEAAASDPTVFGVPKQAPSLEGFLFPATYPFEPGTTAEDILQQMVTRMNQSLDAAGVPEADRLEVLTLASIIQKEGGVAEDFPKVSRVFTNRLETGMNLQSDATVSYGTGGTSIFTTDAERADASNLYNTYANPGLPIGPISAPGDAAIDAAENPVDGDWLYFVLVNGETGETKFSTTLAEHEAGVAQFQQWLRDNPDYETG
jgi:UPF0755 protein